MAEVEIALSLAAMCSEGVLDAEKEHNLYCIYTGHNHSVLAWYGCGTVLHFRTCVYTTNVQPCQNNNNTIIRVETSRNIST